MRGPPNSVTSRTSHRERLGEISARWAHRLTKRVHYSVSRAHPFPGTQRLINGARLAARPSFLPSARESGMTRVAHLLAPPPGGWTGRMVCFGYWAEMKPEAQLASFPFFFYLFFIYSFESLV
jgi:cell wall assembly regulator SMI1